MYSHNLRFDCHQHKYAELDNRSAHGLNGTPSVPQSIFVSNLQPITTNSIWAVDVRITADIKTRFRSQNLSMTTDSTEPEKNLVYL